MVKLVRLSSNCYLKSSGREPTKLSTQQTKSTDRLQKGDSFNCPFCGTNVILGRHVCLGCRAEVVYGATQSELEESAKTGFLVGGFLAFLLLFMLPKWLNYKFAWNLAPGFGLGVYSFFAGGVVTLVMGGVFAYTEENMRRKKPPRCFRNGVAMNVEMR